MKIQLFAIKPSAGGSEIYYVPAEGYGEAVEKYKEVMREKCGQNATIHEPEKVSLACDAAHLLMPFVEE